MASDQKDKKRKASAVEPHVKKPKKTKTLDSVAAKPEKKSITATAPETPVDVPATSKFPARKRAADFLSDDEDEAPPSKALEKVEPTSKKKSKKSKGHTNVDNSAKNAPDKVSDRAGIDVPLAAQQNRATTSKKQKSKTVNGSSDHPKSKKSTATEPNAGKKTDEIESDESGAELAIAYEEEEDDDQAAALLAGFDDDEIDNAQDKGLDADTPMPALSKKVKKRLSKVDKNSAGDGPGTVYIGRIPHGFYEHQMRAYFSQFGDITKLRLSRNRKSGASKHFAFLEFASSEVAKIAAASMDNYLLFGHILKCKFVPQENVHPDTWKGANRRYKATPWNKLEKQILQKPKTEEQWAMKNAKEQKRREEKQKKMKEMGYEFKAPQLKSAADLSKDNLAEKASLAMTPKPAANAEAPVKTNKRKEKKLKIKEQQKQLDSQLLGEANADITYGDAKPAPTESAIEETKQTMAANTITAKGAKSNVSHKPNSSKKEKKLLGPMKGQGVKKNKGKA